MSDYEVRAQWRSFTSYVLVTTGAMVGLGNVFQFPFLVIKYGGLFVLFYLICQLSVALPLLFAELMIGRRGRQNPVGSIGLLAMEVNANSHWRALGWFCVIIAMLTLIYYTVSAAFPMGYFLNNVKDIWQNVAPLNGVVELENDIMSNHFYLEVCFIIFISLAMFVVYRGINRGLEEISMITVPLYFIILLSLAVYVSTLGYFGQALQNLFTSRPDITFYEVFLVALALAFMKYKIGMGLMIVYGSYLPYHVSLTKSTLVVVVIDGCVSLLSYFILFPLTLASNNHADFSLLSNYNVLNVFNGLPGGIYISAIFFFAAILISWTPIIAMAEAVVVTFVERLHWTRKFSSLVLISVILILGSIEVFAQLPETAYYQLHNLLRNITLDVLTPVVAFLIAIFAGWIITRNISEYELHFKPFFYSLWLFLLRFVVPVAVAIVLFTFTVLERLPF